MHRSVTGGNLAGRPKKRNLKKEFRGEIGWLKAKPGGGQFIDARRAISDFQDDVGRWNAGELLGYNLRG